MATFSRRAFILALAYVSLWFVIGLFPTAPTDLDLFAWPSAQLALSGHLFAVYTHPLPIYTLSGPDIYLNDIPPLSLIPLTAIGLLLRLLHHPDSVPLLHAFTFAIFSLFTLLMAHQAILAIERLRSVSLVGRSRFYAYAVFALAPPVWQSLLGYGHIEQPLEVYLLLLALRHLDSSRLFRAGFLLGLAVLSRSTAALFALPIAFALLRRAPIAAVKFFALTTLTGLTFLLPFYITDSSDLIHALFTSRALHPIYAGSIWALLRSTPFAVLGQHVDIAFVALLALLLNLFLATRRGGFTPLRFYAGLALTGASFLVFTKTLWPYYFFETFVFVCIFFFARYSSKQSRAWLVLPPLVISVLSLSAEIGVTPFISGFIINAEAVGMFVLLAGAIGLVIYLASSEPTKQPQAELVQL